MAMKYPMLFSPIKVGTHVLKNRIICPPTSYQCSGRDVEQYPVAEAIAHYAAKARGGAALVTLTDTSFVPTEPSRNGACWDLYSRNALNGMSEMAEAVHFYGAKIAMELFSAGTRGSAGYAVCDGIILPSGEIGKEMPEEEMIFLANSYAEAAARLKEAGFDGVCLHFAHGWQIAQFISPLTNKRTDKYGGSPENRARFPKMIIDTIRQRVGKDMLIYMRISGDEFEPGSLGIEEAIEFTAMVQDNLDMVNVSAGLHNAKWFTVTHACGFLPENPLIYLAEAFKKSGKIKIPVMGIGAIQDPGDAERFLQEGKADLIGIARGYIADHELGIKAFQGRAEDVRPCVKCMRCHDSAVFEHRYRCTVNPYIGMEDKLGALIPPTTPKKVAVVGGGPAGLQAALTAAERGHQVTLFEKSDKLGGAIGFADYVSFKYPLNKYRKWLIAQAEKAKIHIRLNCAAAPEALKAEGYDVILVALGAKPAIPPIPGVENAKLAVDVYGHEAELGDSVVVIGGGQVGCETALHLAKLGKKAMIVEMQAKLAPDASTTHRDELMNQLYDEANLDFVTGARCTGVEAGKVSVLLGEDNSDKATAAREAANSAGAALNADQFKKEQALRVAANAGESREFRADCVILAAGMQALEDEAFAFYGAADTVIPIGDCVKARTVEQAVREGYYAALRI